jgi:hypothetical protein
VLAKCVGKVCWQSVLAKCVGKVRWQSLLAKCVGKVCWQGVLAKCVGDKRGDKRGKVFRRKGRRSIREGLGPLEGRIEVFWGEYSMVGGEFEGRRVLCELVVGEEVEVDGG